MKRLKIVIVDDHQMFREGLKILLEGRNNIEEVIDVPNGKEFLKLLNSYKPEIVFMDIEMPEMDGITATNLAIQKYPDIKIIALSMYGDENYYSAMINAGAKGFIIKNAGFDEVASAIQLVAEGNYFFSGEIMSKLVKGFTKQPESTKEPLLTDREMEVLLLICHGYSNQEIAEKLSISKRTVDKHRENILSKTSTKNTAGLVIYSIKHGLLKI